MEEHIYFINFHSLKDLATVNKRNVTQLRSKNSLLIMAM